MSHTRDADDRDIIPNRANSYASIHATGDPADTIYNSHLNWPPILRIAAGLHSTAEDLANWLIAIRTGECSSIERAGVLLLAATDVGVPLQVPGISLHVELERLVEAGLSPLGALRTATLNPARVSR